MSLLKKTLAENRLTVALALPMVAGYVGQMLMGWADTIMVGRVGVTPLAACAFANTILMVPLVFSFGLLSSVSVKASRAFGRRDKTLCGEILRAGLLIGGAIGLFVGALIHVGLPLLPVFGQTPEVTATCKNFLVLCGWSVPAVFVTTVAKNFSEALGRPWPPFWIVMGGVFLNIGLNWIFIYGNLGAPAMGLDGAGLSTLVARIATMLAVLLYVFRAERFHAYLPSWPFFKISGQIKELIKLGLPSGTMNLAEVTGFSVGSIMMGWIGINSLAAHQIALTCASTTFMIPLGVSQAASVRIGHALGMHQPERCLPIATGALGFIVLLMAVFAAFFVSEGTWLAGLFVNDAAVIGLAAQLLLLAGVFQIFDGVQVVCAGALRGFEDTRVPMFMGVIAYWLVAIPVSYLAAFTFGQGPQGIWMGLVAGLFVAGAALATRLWQHLKKVC